MSTFLNDGPVFGPVHSRRLGISLGVNLMPPEGKICTFDCLYCENGLNAQRRCAKGHASADEVEAALASKLKEMAAEGALPDVITFAGNGEPTAAPEFPEAVRRAVALRDRLAPSAKIAVLSNGTFAKKPEVKAALMLVDDNILKLDTVDDDYIRLLDRPVGAYSAQEQVETFAGFGGHVIVQTMFLDGEFEGRRLRNYGDECVDPWLKAIDRIRPQEVTIYTVARETPVPGLQKCPADRLDEIARRVEALGIPCQVSY